MSIEFQLGNHGGHKRVVEEELFDDGGDWGFDDFFTKDWDQVMEDADGIYFDEYGRMDLVLRVSIK